MRKFFIVAASSFFAVLSAIFLNSCVKDNCKRTYTYSYYVPVYKTTAEIKAGIKNDAAREVINPGKLVLLGNYIFLNEIDNGIHVIDNRNPASPQNIAFINIPGNMDLALKGNTLYADLYTDLVTIDISNPLDVSVKKYNEGVFPYRAYGSGFYDDTTRIIACWIKRDTTITENCVTERWGTFDSQVYYNYSSAASSSGNKNSVSPIGMGGSMARFAIVNNRMYTVSNSDLNVFNITIPNDPVYNKKVNVGTLNVETIFPFKNKLFIGSQNGMFVYNINNPDKPALAGQFSHVQSCDPIIADDDYAYVTLRTGSACFGNTNQLDILRLNNFTNPTLVKSYSFKNPHGLSKDGYLLFICDGSDGLKIYNSKEIANLQLIKQFSNIETYDVIAFNNIALVVAKDGLYQYDYSDVNNIHLVSKIGITRK
ncbi:MAG: hypothetical protein ABI325_01085 [Ginsengibacter sp.]